MQKKKAIIVASGPSARGFVPPKGITIIAVNGAIEWLSRADYFFTLDWAKVNMGRMAHRRQGVKYTAAFPESKWVMPWVKYYKRGEDRTIKQAPYGTPEYWLMRLRCKLGLSEDPTTINTGNSAYGALGLAYHLGFTDVALIGVDATREARIEGGHSRNLSHLPLLFASALPQINVVSCGKMGGIPKMKMEDFIHG